MSNITLVADSDPILSYVNTLKAIESPFNDSFAERLQLFFDGSNLSHELITVKRDYSAATAGEVRVIFEPSEAFLCLGSALLAGDGDFSTFDHKYPFSQSTELKQ